MNYKISNTQYSKIKNSWHPIKNYWVCKKEKKDITKSIEAAKEITQMVDLSGKDIKRVITKIYPMCSKI